MDHRIKMARLDEIGGWSESLLCAVWIVNGPRNPDGQTK